MTKESYRIVISSANCRCVVKCNDFIIFTENKGLQSNTEIPVNYLLFAPYLDVSAVLSPMETGKMLEANVRFTLTVKKLNKTSGAETVLDEYKFSGDKPVPKAAYTKRVEVSPSEMLSTWPKLQTLELKRDILAEMTVLYKKIWQFFSDKDIDGLMAFLETRESIYAQAQFESLNERKQRTLATYEEHCQNSEFELYRFLPDSFPPSLSCYGHLLSLEDSKHFHPIFFVNKKRTQTICIPFYFGRKDDKLVVVL